MADCPVTRKQFVSKAKPIALEVAGQKTVANVKEFSTGSLGWHFSGKLVIDVDGVPCKVQGNLSLVVVGSKEI